MYVYEKTKKVYFYVFVRMKRKNIVRFDRFPFYNCHEKTKSYLILER